MERQIINPWTWQDQFGFAHGVAVPGGAATVYCAGQISVDADGNPIHDGDMAAQLGQAFDNLDAVLRESGCTLSDVVRLNYYTTDIDAFFGAIGDLVARLAEGNCRPASTLLAVSRLAFPQILVEIEATAVTGTGNSRP